MFVDFFLDTEQQIVPYTRFIRVMRTLACGSIQDKADVLFRLFDYQKQGWLEYREFIWILSIGSQPLEPIIRRGYTFRDMVRWLFETFDANGDGFLSFSEFCSGMC